MKAPPSAPEPLVKAADAARRGGLARDLLVVFLLVGVVVANSAHSPANTYAYAQLLQIGASVSMLQTGELLLPRNQMGRLARKPQLYTWCQAAVLWVTGVYNDFTFRLPTVAASFVAAALVYLLGRRWYGRRTGLLAACLWAAAHHMSKLMYVSLTDMMLTMWVTGSIFCADRLLFHRAPRGGRKWYVLGLWATIILAALTKGWGVLNLAVVGGMLALAAGVGGGFGVLRAADGLDRKLLVAFRLIGRRWRRAMKATRFGWGMLATAAVLAPVWVGMFVQGGAEFREIVHFEIWQRITGAGALPPKASSVPQAANLLYYFLPGSVFAVGAFFLVHPRRWFKLRSPVFLPLCWVLAVLVPFSLIHGGRPDYLLPCYGAMALLGAWAVQAVASRGRGAGRAVGVLRHVFAGVGVTAGALLAAAALGLLFQPQLPAFVRKAIRLPASAGPLCWWVLPALALAGLLLATWAVRESLRWRVRRVAFLAVVAMPGIMFVYTHFLSRHARYGDGEKMLLLAEAARPLVGGDGLAVFMTGRISVPQYLGRHIVDAAGLERLKRKRPAGRTETPRLGRRITSAEELDGCDIPWLLTCDRGLIELGAARAVPAGDGQIAQLAPGDLGTVRLASAPVRYQKWGRVYLIRVRRPIVLSGTPRPTPYISGWDED